MIIAIQGQIGVSFAILATHLSKVSFGITLLKLVMGFWRYVVWFALSTLAVVAIPSLILPWVLCTPIEKGFDDRVPGHCYDKQIALRYGVFDAIWAASMDYVLALLPWVILWKLQMKRAEKIGVGIAMSLGVLSGTVAIIKSIYVHQLLHQDFSCRFILLSLLGQ